MEKVSADGVITIEESKTSETYSEVVEGMMFDRGYISPYMATDMEKMEAVVDDAYIVGAVDLLGVGLDGSHGGLHGLGNALLHDDGVGPGGQILQALAHDGLGQQGGGGGAVAGHVVGLGGNFPRPSWARASRIWPPAPIPSS